METRTIKGAAYIRLDTPEELDAWIRDNGWESASDFEHETGMPVARLVHRWFYIQIGKYGDRYVHRYSPNVVTVPV
jgi:hypothetical protein